MELGAISLPQLLEASRENVIYTYCRLGQSLEGGIVEAKDGYLQCSSPIELSFGNFIIDLHLSNDPSKMAIQIAAIKSFMRSKDTARLFLMPGDEPSDIRTLLVKSGLHSHHRLIQLASQAPPGDCAELRRAESPREREDVAGFMVRQFFWRREGSMRHHIVAATANPGHDLLYLLDGGEMIGAVMLMRSELAVGLYNLCISEPHRERGLGALVVRAVQQLAWNLGLPVTLQCDKALQSWYERLNFVRTGTVESFVFGASSLV